MVPAVRIGHRGARTVYIYDITKYENLPVKDDSLKISRYFFDKGTEVVFLF